MPADQSGKKHPGGRDDPVSGYSIMADKLVQGIFRIKPEDREEDRRQQAG